MSSPFLSAVAENMRMKHYAEKTIKAYLYWIKSFIYFNQKNTLTNAMIKKYNIFFHIQPANEMITAVYNNLVDAGKLQKPDLDLVRIGCFYFSERYGIGSSLTAAVASSASISCAWFCQNSVLQGNLMPRRVRLKTVFVLNGSTFSAELMARNEVEH